MVILRPDQAACLQAVQAHLLAKDDPLLFVAPTGFGKTVLFAKLTKLFEQAQDLYYRPTRVFILVHRTELLEQVSRTLTDLDVAHGVISPYHPNQRRCPIQVASVFSLVRRLADYEPADLLIVDEAHHAIPGSTWGRVLLAWPKAKRFGVTATPERLGGQGLRDLFPSMLIGPSVKTLIDAGHLSPYRLFAPPQHAADKVHRRRGDFDKHELGDAMDQPTITGDAVEHYRRLAHGKRAIVFCVSVNHAAHVAEQFRTDGYAAASIDGELSRYDRKTIIERFRAGTLTVLTSCDLISEGFDLPSIEVALLLRPTQSLALHLQQIGRALRTFPGKEQALILDHAGNTMRHGLPDDERQWSLDGKEKREASEDREKTIAVRTCPLCFSAVRVRAQVCPYCMAPFPSQERTVMERKGTLVEVDPSLVRFHKSREVADATTYDQLKAIERARGYRRGWAHHVYMARQRKQYARK